LAKLCSPPCAGKLWHDRLVDQMLNRLIMFRHSTTTAEQRCTPQSRADGLVAPRARRTPITPRLSLRRSRTAIAMTLAMPTAPTIKAMPPRAHPGGPARRRFSAEEVLTSAAVTLTPHDIGPEPSRRPALPGGKEP
jgi:hypothetical protein